VDMEGFKKGLEEQKQRSRQAAELDKSDWVVLSESDRPGEFLGYEQLEAEVKLLRYREVKEKQNTYYELVLDKTPFYAESGGQVGDKGILRNKEVTIKVFDTKKENDLTIHLAEKGMEGALDGFTAIVDRENRRKIENNHSATHLMHYALRKVLGEHVEQKGSLVDAEHLRFDFSHFEKMTDEEVFSVEKMVNAMIRNNDTIDEHRAVEMQQAMDMGALAFFGEKYGDKVRVVRFGDSIELCGGTHVPATGQIGYFKIVSESAIAAGVRRIEAITGEAAENFVQARVDAENKIRELLKNTKDIVKGVRGMIDENKKLQKLTETLNRKVSGGLLTDLESAIKPYKGVDLLTARVDADLSVVKNIAFSLIKNNKKVLAVLGSTSEGKAFLTVAIGEKAIKANKLNAGSLIRELAKEIKGGGGGQPHFATAGGKDPSGIQAALDKVKTLI
ncbi:MAG: alanine--tRNA ligase, partial [Bacteroidales bacterium]|nr:alanine--tRNA ligase [Bacteroidales bacterium]